MLALSRLAGRAPQHLKMKIYFCVNPEVRGRNKSSSPPFFIMLSFRNSRCFQLSEVSPRKIRE
jgi:hypothetical protein